MKNKRKLFTTVMVILLGILCWFSNYLVIRESNPSWTPNLSPLDSYMMEWELGEEIIPYPPYAKWLDCDDAVMYSYLYLQGLYKNLDIKIMKGSPYGFSHVWLLVSDNETSIVYDWGLPCEDTTLYKGREISYKQLIGYVYRDLD